MLEAARLRRYKWCYVALLMLASAVVFAGTLAYPFIGWDDYAFYLDDPATQSLTLAHLKQICCEARVNVWYPLARLSHALDYALFGENAAASRAINIVLHAVNAWFVSGITFVWLKFFSPAAARDKQFVAAACVGLLFCVHPQHVEAVVWIAQRKELLSALGVLASVYCYSRFLIVERCSALRWYAISFGVLAMLAKPIAMTLFPVLLLLSMSYCVATTGRLRVRDWFQEFWLLSPLLVAGVVVGLVVLFTHGQSNSLALDHVYSLAWRADLSGYNFLHALMSWVWPTRLAPAHDFPASVRGSGYWFVVQFAPMLLGYLVARRFGKIGWILFVLLCASWIIHFPVSGIIMFGTYAWGDRYFYLASVPLFVLAGLALGWLMLRISMARMMIPLLMLVCTFAFLAQQQTRIWKNNGPLWAHVVENYPLNGMSLYYLGDQYRKINHIAEAIVYMEAALRQGPVLRGYPSYSALSDLPELYKQVAQPARAVDAYTRLMKYEGENARVYAAMGVLQLGNGNPAEAIQLLDHAYMMDSSIAQELQQQLQNFSGEPQRQLAGWLLGHRQPQ